MTNRQKPREAQPEKLREEESLREKTARQSLRRSPRELIRKFYLSR